MANGIATTRMVIEMARAGMLGFFGAAGLGQVGPARLVAQGLQLAFGIPNILKDILSIGLGGRFGGHFVGGLGCLIVDRSILQIHSLLRRAHIVSKGNLVVSLLGLL